MENPYVRIEVAGSDASIRRIIDRQAATFPFIADKGAQIAGIGEFFVPDWMSAAQAPHPRLTESRSDLLVFQAPLGPGLFWERRIHLPADESAFSIEDRVRNGSDGPRQVELRLRSDQAAEPWRQVDRTWVGGPAGSREFAVWKSKQAGPPVAAEGRSLFWRQIEEYGTGFLARYEGGAQAGSLRAEAGAAPGYPVRVTWHSGSTTVPPGGAASVEIRVSVDEGGGAPDQRNAFAPVLARADFAHAGQSGQPLFGFATVVSPRSRRVRVRVEDGRSLADAELDLTPGKVARLPVNLLPLGKELGGIRVIVSEVGKEIARAECRPLIDGDRANPAWQAYHRRMPEEYYRGTWEAIGRQLVTDRSRLLGPNSVEVGVATAPDADNGLTYFSRHLPYYAGLLRGIAQAKSAPAKRILLTENRTADREAACMDVAFYGPDGPINAFSKERNGTSFSGLGYLKVVPAAGYRFHTYMHYGINSEGLSISGATLNEDAATTAWGSRESEAWARAGKLGVPPRIGIWMLLASCRTVDQALAMINDPVAPILFSPTDMLLLDRAGHAACVESAGFDCHVYRHGDRIAGFYVSGNYPHPTPDGHFQIGADWGWAANTMLREVFLRQTAGPRQGHLGLTDVLSLMQSHEAGGMCQHIYDNPGHLYTTCSFIAVTRTGDLWLSQGPPCETAYVRHTLDP